MDHEKFTNCPGIDPEMIYSDSQVSEFERSTSDEGRVGAGMCSKQIFTLQSPPQAAVAERIDMLFGRVRPRLTITRETSIFSDRTKRRWEIAKEARAAAVGQHGELSTIAISLYSKTTGNGSIDIHCEIGLCH
jgi:hypothetical protein